MPHHCADLAVNATLAALRMTKKALLGDVNLMSQVRLAAAEARAASSSSKSNKQQPRVQCPYWLTDIHRSMPLPPPPPLQIVMDHVVVNHNYTLAQLVAGTVATTLGSNSLQVRGWRCGGLGWADEFCAIADPTNEPPNHHAAPASLEREPALTSDAPPPAHCSFRSAAAIIRCPSWGPM